MLFEEERKRQIVEYVFQHNRASVQELSRLFQVSESTVRRDLKELEDAKLLRRTHGGAVPLQNDNVEPDYGEKMEQFRKEKEAIAQEAMKLVKDGDTILLDAGTTTYHMARLITGGRKLTVVTNSMMAANELQGKPGIELLLVGGFLRHETLALVGPVAEQTLRTVKVDKAFIATNGLDPVAGLTTPNYVEAVTKRCMIEAAKQVILLADHSKYGQISFAKFADVAEIDECIVDDGFSESAIKQFEDIGIMVTVAGTKGGEQ